MNFLSKIYRHWLTKQHTSLEGMYKNLVLKGHIIEAYTLLDDLERIENKIDRLDQKYDF